jgi:hypothetical protein
MNKNLNADNLLIVANIATQIDGFHLLAAISLCIDEWYLSNPIMENVKYASPAKEEFNNLVLGKEYNSLKKTHHTHLMTECLIEFFEIYIAPKYVEIQETVYKYLDYLKETEPERIYVAGSEFEYSEFKIEHEEELLDLIRNNLTDWNFGFEVKLSE